MAKPDAAFPRGDHDRRTTRRSAGASRIRAWRRCSRSSRWARRARTWPSATASRARSRTRSRSARSSAGPRPTRPGASPTSSSRSATSTRDEHPRPDTSAEKLAALKPAFREGGTRHRRQLERDQRRRRRARDRERGEGARARRRAARRVRRRARSPGVDPRVMGIGPVPAVRKLLDRAGVEVGDLDLVELNEAFASQSLVVIRELGLDPEKVNVNGGAIAIGHPLGMSGARLVVTLLHELRRRGGRYGLATLCVGVGQGQAALFERELIRSSATSSSGLRLGRHDEDLVDAYYGPEEIARRVEAEEPREPAALAEDAERARRGSPPATSGSPRRLGHWPRTPASSAASGSTTPRRAGSSTGSSPAGTTRSPSAGRLRSSTRCCPASGDAARALRELVRGDGDPGRAGRAGGARRGRRAAAADARGDRPARGRGVRARARHRRALARLRPLPRRPAHQDRGQHRPAVAGGRPRAAHLARDLRRAPHASRLAGDRARTRPRRARAHARRALVARGRDLGGNRR